MLTLIAPPLGDENRERRLREVLSFALQNEAVQTIATAEALAAANLRQARILFAVALPKTGINMEYSRMLSVIRTRRLARRFLDSAGAVLVDGAGELYTKALARELAFAANRAGLAFPGKGLVEGTGSLYNFGILGKVYEETPFNAYKRQARLLVEKLKDFSEPRRAAENILVVHAGNEATSNSLMLWRRAGTYLEGKAGICEIAIRNGEVVDCRGCPYETCRHFGENGQCFYGGVMVEKIYPALLKADTLVLVCPNYNDALSANMMAFINRLTALFRSNSFSGKRVYAVVVSGYSGSDLVAQQVLGAMSFNKNMVLPPDFALLETANEPGSILSLPGIEVRAKSFAARILGASL